MRANHDFRTDLAIIVDTAMISRGLLIGRDTAYAVADALIERPRLLGAIANAAAYPHPADDDPHVRLDIDPDDGRIRRIISEDESPD